MSVQDMFKGLGKATTAGTRIPDPKVGEGYFLLNTMRMAVDKNDKDYIKMIFTCLHSLGEEGNQKGDKVSVALFKGGVKTEQYFYQEMKSFLVALTNTSTDELDELTEALCAQYEEEDGDLAWSKLGLSACARDAEGKEVAAGTFDGQAAAHLRTFVKEGKVIEGEFMSEDGTPTGKMIPKRTKDFPKTLPVSGVALSDIAGYLDEKDMERFFGSEEKFAELLEEESA